jgi:hypothetical protein
MEKYISQKDLESIYKKELKSHGKKGIDDIVIKKRAIDSTKFEKQNIFLSHSHIDKTIVSKISLLFNKLNTVLYIDWLDKSMPEQTNNATAVQIKNKIRTSNKFLFLATYHGLRSKWCNWELGIADILKTEDNLAILPIQTKSGNWKGNEYLQLYPEMHFDVDQIDDLNENNISIKKVSGESVSLIDWLNN